MKASELNLLSQALTAINNLKTTAAGAGVIVDQVAMRFPDGAAVSFNWSDEMNDWDIKT